MNGKGDTQRPDDGKYRDNYDKIFNDKEEKIMDDHISIPEVERNCDMDDAGRNLHYTKTDHVRALVAVARAAKKYEEACATGGMRTVSDAWDEVIAALARITDEEPTDDQ